MLESFAQSGVPSDPTNPGKVMKNYSPALLSQPPFPLRYIGVALQVVALVMLAYFLTGTAEARVFKPKEVGVYLGDGSVRAVVDGVARPPQSARSRIRVRSNSLGLDGVNFRLSNGKIRGRYFAYGLSMVLDGTYRRAGKRLLARGGVEIFSLETASTVNASWAFRLSVDGKRAQYVLAISIPHPESPGIPIATINARAQGTRSN
jgi:hypothetical protein